MASQPHHLQARSQNLRKVTISLGVSVCLSVDVEQLGFHWMDFHKT
jgi:hypothetical protein